MKQTIQKILTSVLALFVSQYIGAAPATTKPVVVTQPDGTRLTILLQGDERSHYAMTLDSLVVAQNAAGYYCYTEGVDNGLPKISTTVAHEFGNRSAQEDSFVAKIKADAVRETVALDGQKQQARKAQAVHRLKGNPNVPATGDFKGLVILANFPNIQFAEQNTQTLIDRMMNEEGFSDAGADGSVRDYFLAQSGGNFKPSFDVVGPVMLSHEYSYYGNDLGGVTDVNAALMIREACELADTECDVDFSKYDNNGDGMVDMVYVIYAGYSQSNGAASTTVWPHMYYLKLSNNQVTLDGVTVNCYATGGERTGTTGEDLMGIGLIAHEFSHTLGMPDIYGSGSYLTMGSFDVMDRGCYNNDAHTPSGYSSFEKSLVGWTKPADLSAQSGQFTLRNMNDYNEAAKISNPNNPNEYFLLEAHGKQNKYDKYLQGEGLLVVHVNYDSLMFDNNEVNTAERKGVHILAANGNSSTSTDLSTVAFTGADGSQNLTDLTDVATVFDDGTEADVPLRNIKFEDGVVSFDVNEKIASPSLTAETDVKETTFKAHWTMVEGAKRYQLRITANSTGEQKLRGPFADTKCTVSGLSASETYTYEVRCRDDYAWSDWSAARIINTSKVIADGQPKKQVAKTLTYNTSGDTRTLTQQQSYFYGKGAKELFDYTHSVNGTTKTRTAYTFKFYDAEGRLAEDSTSLNKLYYYYDEQGNKVKEVKWSNYNNPKYQDVKQDSTLYYYNNGVLDSVQYANYGNTKDVYFYNTDGQLEHIDRYGIDYYDNYQYQIVQRTYYTYDAVGNMTTSEIRSLQGGVEQSGMVSRYVYDEANRLVRDTLVAAYSASAHEYTYDSDGLPLLTKTSSYNSYTDTWTNNSETEYVYGTYTDSRLVGTITPKVSADEPTDIILSFVKPTETETLVGYQLMLDDELQDSVYQTKDAALTLARQQRGSHTGRLMTVYEDGTANISDLFAYNVEVTLPTAKNIRLTIKEYSGSESYGSWYIKATWDDPATSPYTLTGYRWTAGSSNGTTTVDKPELSYTDYGWGSKTPVIKVYAVYDVGEADADSLQISIEDHDDQITAHYHNATSTVKDSATGKVVSSKHFLYTPINDGYNSGENLLATVELDADGTPLYRYDASGNEKKAWNKETHDWDDYQLTETLGNSLGVDSVTTVSRWQDGQWVVTDKTFALYNNPDNRYTATDYKHYAYNGADSTLVESRHRYRLTDMYGNILLQTDSLYDGSGNLTGKTETTFYRYGVTLCETAYAYADGEFTPTTRLTNAFDDNANQSSALVETYEDGAWKATTEEVYADSKEYSLTHTPSADDMMLDGDGDIVVWAAPKRTTGLTGYAVYVNDVWYAATEDTRFSFVNAFLPKGSYKVRVMALYDGNESCVSDEIEVEVLIPSGIENLNAAMQSWQDATSVEVFDTAGRTLAHGSGSDLSTVLGNSGRQTLIVKGHFADGSVKVVKILKP